MITSNHQRSVLPQARVQFLRLRPNGAGDLIEKPVPLAGQVTSELHSRRCVHLLVDQARRLELLQ